MAEMHPLPNFEEVRLGLEAARAAGAKCFRYEIGDRVMVFDLSDVGAASASPLEQWRAKHGTS